MIVEPDEVDEGPNRRTGRKEVLEAYTAVVLAAGLRGHAFAEATAEGRRCKCRRCYSSWGFSAAIAGCWSWATVPPGFEPGLRAWGFPSKRSDLVLVAPNADHGFHRLFKYLMSA